MKDIDHSISDTTVTDSCGNVFIDLGFDAAKAQVTPEKPGTEKPGTPSAPSEAGALQEMKVLYLEGVASHQGIESWAEVGMEIVGRLFSANCCTTLL